MQPAIQLYTLRNVDASILEIIDRVGETSLDGVEFASRVTEAPPEEIGEHLEAAGLEPVSAHVGIEDLEADLTGEVEQAKAIGYDDIVVPWLDPEHFESVAAIEDAAARLSDIAADLDEDLTLHYHNHQQEFQETEQGHAFHVLAEQAPEVNLQVDAGWVLAGGVDPVDLINQYADRITLVHVKDVWLEREEVPAFGDGDVDLEGVIEASKDAGADWLIFENDEPDDPLAELDSGAEILDQLL